MLLQKSNYLELKKLFMEKDYLKVMPQYLVCNKSSEFDPIKKLTKSTIKLVMF